MIHDLLIIGGGINGCAIAREAALNGLAVLLVEKDDLAQHTSSASTKLIHGGLRYLEQYDFRLVREALVERERLLAAAPHLITPLRFVLPHDHAVRPWWMIRAGLYLYDALAGRSALPRSRALRRDDRAYNAPLKRAGKGFVYSDAWVDDARLTIANAIDAAEHGAVIATRTAFEGAERRDDCWHAALSDGRTVAARAIVVAAGAWTPAALGRMGVAPRGAMRLVKGSHIVVPPLFEGDHAYMLQQPDRRIVFAIPYQRGTMIGTTDVPVEHAEDAVIAPEEIDYLCAAANRYFERQVAPADVTSSWSGVRGLYDDGASEAAQVTRDYVLEIDDAAAPVLSVFGGKITTARALGEDALARLAPLIGREVHPVTRARVFPGGMIASLDQFGQQVAARWPFLAPGQIERLTSAYGSRLIDLLEGAERAEDMGDDVGGGLTAREIRWLRDREWACTAEDVLMRRTRLGLHLDAEVAARVDAILQA